ncbi:MAG: hypothetical protein ACXU82_03745 [Caulobacteraceae bacterium]
MSQDQLTEDPPGRGRFAAAFLAAAVASMAVGVLVLALQLLDADGRVQRLRRANDDALQALKQSQSTIEAQATELARYDAEIQEVTDLPPPMSGESEPGPLGADYTWQPPFALQNGGLVSIFFTTAADVEARCGPFAAACETRDGLKRPLLIMPNPCRWGAPGAYARTLCHELGHANGWPGDHRSGHRVPEDPRAGEPFAVESGTWVVTPQYPEPMAPPGQVVIAGPPAAH